MTELLASIGFAEERPAEIARRLGINRTLAWKAARIAAASPARDAVDYLPGEEGVAILLGACSAAGAPTSVVQQTRASVAALEAVIAAHAGDRETLDLMLASAAREGHDGERTVEARRLAFMGNSAIWGIQARVRFTAYFLAPSRRGGGLLDAGTLGGLADVRRLRADVGVPLFMMHHYNDDGSPHQDSGDPPAELPAVADFCSDRLPVLAAARFPGGVRYDLPPGPVGNAGRMTWVYWYDSPDFASMYCDEVNRVGEHGTRVFVPVEVLLCDLYVHRALTFALSPEFAVYSQLGGAGYPTPAAERDRLPLDVRLTDIGHTPPVPATPLVPHFGDMVAYAFQRRGWDAAEFHGFRVTMRYPPIPALALFRHPLVPPPPK